MLDLISSNLLQYFSKISQNCSVFTRLTRSELGGRFRWVLDFLFIFLFTIKAHLSSTYSNLLPGIIRTANPLLNSHQTTSLPHSCSISFTQSKKNSQTFTCLRQFEPLNFQKNTQFTKIDYSTENANRYWNVISCDDDCFVRSFNIRKALICKTHQRLNEYWILILIVICNYQLIFIIHVSYLRSFRFLYNYRGLSQSLKYRKSGKASVIIGEMVNFLEFNYYLKGW